MNKPIYFESCNKKVMSYYSFFIPMLKKIQDITDKIELNDNKNILSNLTNKKLNKILKNTTKCQQCKTKIYYKLGNIVWPDIIEHIMKIHHEYPSEYFIKVIVNTCIIDNRIINPPICLDKDEIKRFNYVPLHYNKLLILDALMHQGSYPRYIVPKQRDRLERFIYSEHSGVISMSDKIIDNIIVSTETNRLDINDSDIYLPINTKILANHEFLFHTHPNTSTYAGRLEDGIIYEFPSANDILNFVKFHDEGIAQASIVIAPEGIYVIRPIYTQSNYNLEMNIFKELQKYILKLENKAINHLNLYLKKLSIPDIFHKYVSSNYYFIDKYNHFLRKYNIMIEYYPREKKNNEWCLRPINLQYISD